MVLPSPNTTESVSDTAAAGAAGAGVVAGGSTIAETLQGLISPGSTVYASAAAAASSTIESGGDTFQTIPPPVAILAPVDHQRPASQPAADGTAGLVTSSSTPAAALTASRGAQSTGVLVQPSQAQGLQDSAALQGVMGGTGAPVYGTGGPMITSDTAAAVQSQVSLNNSAAIAALTRTPLLRFVLDLLYKILYDKSTTSCTKVLQQIHSIPT